METVSFAARDEEGDGFERYRRLYGIGTDVERSDGPFRARLRIRRFRRMILYERELGGLMHQRGPSRVRHDGFDHLAIHLLLAGDLTGVPMGAGHRLRVGEIIQSMLRGVIDVLRTDDPRLLKQIRDQDDVVDRLHEAIKTSPRYRVTFDALVAGLLDYIGEKALVRRD